LIDTYTDNSNQSTNGLGSSEQLTLQQSEAIQNYLVTRGGWTPGSVSKRSNGADMPVMDNQTPSGRAANRRIEFIITQDR
jgi:outer membrane protein OmpA-like peptidoglycan-associated protein